MTKKRFILNSTGGNYAIEDNQENIGCFVANKSSGEYIVDLLNELNDENEQLKQQLLYDGDDVCGICKHEYLTPSGDYFIGKCEKGHEECSKEDIKYCEDFELKGDVE